MRTIYLDHAASTPVDPEVFAAMKPYFTAKAGNPGSLHGPGQAAMAAVDLARETIATVLGANFREIVFTGSATEANNLALRGAVAGWRNEHPGRTPRIIVSEAEHESVLETAAALKAEGADLATVGVDRHGRLDLASLRAALGPDVAVVSLMYGNNETGTVFDLRAAAALITERRNGPWPLFHSDAVQAFQYLECRPGELGLDLMTISAHKMNGPKGVGLLYVREAVRPKLVPVVTGGGQEFGLRSGTENVPLIAGFAAAIRSADARRPRARTRTAAVARKFWEKLHALRPRTQINGVRINEGAGRLPHILSLHVPGVPAEVALMALDKRGIAVSAGSACTSRSARPSHVLRAMGCPDRMAKETIRVSFGKDTTLKDALAAAKAIADLKI